MSNAHQIAQKLQTTASHIIQAHKSQEPIRGKYRITQVDDGVYSYRCTELATYGQAISLYRTDALTEEEWVAARSDYIGASEVAAVLGLHSYTTPLDIWHAKCGDGDDFDGNYRTERGHHMEGFIAEKAADQEGWDLDPAEVVLQHPEHEMLRCNLDFWERRDSVPVEVKMLSSYAKDDLKSLQAGTVPEGTMVEAYYVQLQDQIGITGAAFGWLAADCDGELFVIRIPRDQDVIDVIESAVPAFWRKHVLEVEPPRASGGDLDRLRDQYDNDETTLEVSDDDELAQLMHERTEAHREYKRAKSRKDDLDAQILELSEGASKIEAPSIKASRVRYERTSLSKSAAKAWLEEHAPEQLDEMMSTYEVDFYRFTETKGQDQ
jgi:putative phage-type endonuclease